MKLVKNKRAVRWGLTLFCVVAASILLAMILSRLSSFRAWIGGVAGAFSPIVWGLCIAYVINPICVHSERMFNRIFAKSKLKDRTKSRLSHALAVAATMLLTILILFGIVMLIVPQLAQSIKTLIANARGYYDSTIDWISRLFENNEVLRDYAAEIIDRIFTFLNNWLENTLLPSAQQLMSAVANGVYSVVRVLFDFLIGLIVAGYMLAGKERYLAQIRKLKAALLSAKAGSRIMEIASHANRVFGGFIRGKLVDSAIIGLLCYLGALVLRLPYAILVASIIGITNVIPFFGPFIGAIPCAFLILIVSPAKCLTFVIFIFLLQQLDGNFIGPRILGDTTGLSSFWVLVSITVFSSLFGFAGMVLGVPVFAVIYILVKDLTEDRLSAKGLPTETGAYSDPENLPDQPKAALEPSEEQPEE